MAKRSASKKRPAKVAKKIEKESKPTSDEEEEIMDSGDENGESKTNGAEEATDKIETEEEVGAEEEEEQDDDEPPKAKKGRVGKAAAKAKGGKKKGKGKAATKKSATPAKSKTVAKKAEASDSESDDPEAEYEVETILEVRNLRKGDREFLVKWKDYPRSKATWEPENNLDCPEKVLAFEKKLENNDLQRNGRQLNVSTSTHSRTTRVELDKVIERKISKTYKKSTELSHGSSVKLSFNQIRLDSATAYTKQPTFTSRNYRKIRRAAAVTCGMALTVGAAVLISSNTPVSWENIQPPAKQLLNSLKTKIEDFYNVVVGLH